MTGGFAVPLYVAGLAADPGGRGGRRASPAGPGPIRPGIGLAVALATLLAFLLFVVGVFSQGWPSGWAWPQVLSAWPGWR